MKIRIKFRKWGALKFIGHLDMMRYFQKAIRRADIDICYSEGFSPHQIMSFAAPLGVGITSDGEYFDIEVNSSMSSEEAIKRLNETMVEGVEITGYVQLPEKAKTAMSLVAAADYILSYKTPVSSDDSTLTTIPCGTQEILCDAQKIPGNMQEIPGGTQKPPCSTQEWEEIIRKEFLEQPSFNVTKTTKKSQRTVDLKPLVYEFKVQEDEGRPQFFLRVSTGSNDNLKPEFVLSSLCEKCGIPYSEDEIQIHRVEVYGRAEETGELISLLDMGNPI